MKKKQTVKELTAELETARREITAQREQNEKAGETIARLYNRENKITTAKITAEAERDAARAELAEIRATFTSEMTANGIKADDIEAHTTPEMMQTMIFTVRKLKRAFKENADELKTARDLCNMNARAALQLHDELTEARELLDAATGLMDTTARALKKETGRREEKKDAQRAMIQRHKTERNELEKIQADDSYNATASEQAENMEMLRDQARRHYDELRDAAKL